MQFVLAGNFNEFVIGDAAPDQERQARGQLQVRNAIGLSRRYVRGLALRADQEWRTGQDAAQTQLDSISKGAFAPAFLIKALYPLPISGSDWPPVCTPHQSGEDLFGTRVLLGLTRWMAGKYFANRGRVFGPGWIERPLDSQNSDRRIVFQLRDWIIFERLAPVLPDEIERWTVVRGQKRNSHHMGAGFHRQRNIDGAIAVG